MGQGFYLSSHCYISRVKSWALLVGDRDSGMRRKVERPEWPLRDWYSRGQPEKA